MGIIGSAVQLIFTAITGIIKLLFLYITIKLATNGTNGIVFNILVVVINNQVVIETEDDVVFKQKMIEDVSDSSKQKQQYSTD
jgi:hypothetical protein